MVVNNIIMPGQSVNNDCHFKKGYSKQNVYSLPRGYIYNSLFDKALHTKFSVTFQNLVIKTIGVSS